MKTLDLPRARAALLSAGALLVCLAHSATAQDTSRAVRIGITVQAGTKPGLLVLPVNGNHGDSVRAILQRDFDYGDRINVVATDSLFAVDSAGGSRGQYNYALYAKLGAVAMVQATMLPTGLHVAVHNVAQQKVERVKDFVLDGTAESPSWRLSLHGVADEIELWLTGVRGIAATRIIYVDVRAGGHVWQIDTDGANATPLTTAESAMSPSWSPKGTHIAYSILPDGGARVVIKELGGQARTLPGTNFSPVFSPDGSTLLYSHLSDNGTDLYAVSPFSSDPPRRVTVGRGAFDNTSPTFSPDGKRIAFTSSKSGHPEVYISDADGTNAEILTQFNYGDQSYQSDPDWSPDGRLIAFQSQVGGNFQITTINLRDRSIKRHTSEGVNDNPSFAPDSRHIVFTSNRTGMRQLFIVDMESARLRQLTHATTGATQGSWSPPLRGR